MKKISLEKINSSNEVTHVKLLVNDKDVGILYLKDEELDIILSCLKRGSFNSDTDIHSDVYTDDNIDSEDEYE